MSYQLIKEDQHSFTVKHPKAGNITIAKAGLDPRVTKKIQGMSKVMLAEGGEVPDDSSSDAPEADGPTGPGAPAGAAPPTKEFHWSDFGNIARSALGFPAAAPPPTDPTGPAPASVPGSDQVASSQAAPMPGDGAPRTPALGASMSLPDFSGSDRAALGALGEMRSGTQAKATAEGKIADQTAKVLGDYQQQAQAIQAQYAPRIAALDQKQAAAEQAYRNGMIDPNRALNSMGTGAKITAAISVLLGGLGAGLTHTSNGALDIINNSIDRDIEAQKVNLGKQGSLLSLYHQQYGDLANAQSAMKLDLLTATKMQIEKASAQSGSAIAQANGQIAMGQIDGMIAQKKHEIAMNDLVRSLGNGAQAGDPMANALKIRLIVPEHQQEAAFKQLGDAENHAKQSAIIMAGFDQANQDNTLGNRAIHSGFEPASVARMQTAIMPYLKDSAGRINEQELERTDALIPKPGDSAQKIAQKKLGMQQYLSEKSSFPLLRPYGINVPDMTGSAAGPAIRKYPAVRGNGR